MRGCALVFAFLALAALAGCGGDGPKPFKAESRSGSVVEADGHKVYFECTGKREPDGRVPQRLGRRLVELAVGGE
jgi:hypothetical protein